MKVKEKKNSTSVFDVYPVGGSSGIRFVRVDNPKVDYSWEELEAHIEVKAAYNEQHNFGVKVPINSSVQIHSSAEDVKVFQQGNKAQHRK